MSRFKQELPGGFDDADHGPTGAEMAGGAASNVAVFPGRKAGSGPSNTQLLIWSVLGLGAIGYLAVSALAPDALHSALPADASVLIVRNVERDVAALKDEVSIIRQSVDGQSAETRQIKATIAEQSGGVEELRRQVNDVTNRTQSLDERVAQVETTKGTSKQSNRATPVQPATTQNAALAPAAADAGLDGLIVDDPPAAPAATMPAKAQVKQPVKPVAVAKIVPPTSLLPKAPLANAPAAADGRVFGVELAISESPQALKLNWELMNEQHQAVLQGLQARSAPAGANFRLLAGPFATVQQANAACARLKQNGQPCKPTAFIGNAL